MTWEYEKLGEDFKMLRCPRNDLDGAITGRCVYGLPAWFDENPEQRIRLGWIKHIKPDANDVQYDKQTQNLVTETVMIDDHTVTDVYHVVDKTEQMMAMEEVGIDMYFAFDSLLNRGVI